MVLTDVDNNLDPAKLAEHEHCYVLAGVTRVGLLKLLESMSRIDYAQKGLNERETVALENLCVVLR